MSTFPFGALSGTPFCTPQLNHFRYCGVKRQPAAKELLHLALIGDARMDSQSIRAL